MGPQNELMLMLSEMNKRLIRIETRTVVLMEAHGIDPKGEPLTDGQPDKCVALSEEIFVNQGETK